MKTSHSLAVALTTSLSPALHAFGCRENSVSKVASSMTNAVNLLVEEFKKPFC